MIPCMSQRTLKRRANRNMTKIWLIRTIVAITCCCYAIMFIHIPKVVSFQPQHSTSVTVMKRYSQNTYKRRRGPYDRMQSPLGSSSIKNDDNYNSNNNDSDLTATTMGIAVLFTVPLAWGTFEVAVRYVYTSSTPIPSLLFSLSYYTIATIALFIINSIINSVNRTTIATITDTSSTSRTATNINNTTLQLEYQQNQEKDTYLTSIDRSNNTGTYDTNSFPLSLSEGTTASSSSSTTSIRGGIELGTYLFIGNLLQLFGLQSIPADRAAFLLQLTTIFVPIVTTLQQQQQVSSSNDTNNNSNNTPRGISIQMWIACFIALFGVALMSLDNDTTSSTTTSTPTPTLPLIFDDVTTSTATSTSSETAMTQLLLFSNDVLNRITVLISQFHWNVGDTLVVMAAMAYTLHCIRLEVFAKQCQNSISLASIKAATEMIWTLGTVFLVTVLYYTSLEGPSKVVSTSIDSAVDGVISFLVHSGQEIQQYMMSIQENDIDIQLPVVLAIFWTGLVPIAYTIVAQTFGQRRVPPVTANLIYTIQPLATAFFAYILLHETLGFWGYTGGLIIGIAVLLIVVETPSSTNSND